MCSLLGCSSTQLLKTPNTVQHRYSGPYANSVKYARSVAYKHKIFLNTGINDTIFIIERVADIGAPLLSSYMWDSKRIRVIKYEVWPTFKSTYFEYSTFDDPLCLLTEKMDTIGIKNKILLYHLFYLKILADY